MATGSYKIEVRADFPTDAQMGIFVAEQQDYWGKMSRLMEGYGFTHSIELIDADNGQVIEAWTGGPNGS